MQLVGPWVDDKGGKYWAAAGKKSGEISASELSTGWRGEDGLGRVSASEGNVDAANVVEADDQVARAAA